MCPAISIDALEFSEDSFLDLDFDSKLSNFHPLRLIILIFLQTFQLTYVTSPDPFQVPSKTPLLVSSKPRSCRVTFDHSWKYILASGWDCACSLSLSFNCHHCPRRCHELPWGMSKLAYMYYKTARETDFMSWPSRGRELVSDCVLHHWHWCRHCFTFKKEYFGSWTR